MDDLQVYTKAIFIISLFMALEGTGEPICYSRKVFSEQHAVVTRVDCNVHSNMVYKQFDSSEESMITSELMEDVLNEDPEKYSPLSDEDVCMAECTPITCSQGDLPVVVNGTFQCSGSDFGDKCQLSCNNGTYPADSSEAICGRDCNSTGVWLHGNFECAGCTEWNRWMESYYRLTEIEGDWNATTDMCRSYSGCTDARLVSIETKKENDHIQKLVSTCSRTWTWIGLQGIGDDWKWGHHDEATYFRWASDQPGTMLNKRCVIMNHVNGRWHDINCDGSFYAVCEGSVCST